MNFALLKLSKVLTTSQRFLAMVLAMALSFAFQLPAAQAQIDNPAKQLTDVSTRARPETVKHLARARVVLADYHLLKTDFPELRHFSSDDIDRWLLERTAFVSLPQIASSSTSSPIPVDATEIQAFRPPDYNRALVFETEYGPIDSKGNGSLKPKPSGHENGLATLGEMIREYAYQRLAQKIFDHAHSGVRTVGCYAVIDYGFQVYHNNGTSSPAGGILRQAHKRADGYKSMLPDSQVVRIEGLLREYGITTTGTKNSKITELLNVQGTVDGAVIDFGAFLATDLHTKPAATINGINRYFVPGTDGVIKANQAFRVPYDLWGSTVSKIDDSKTDNPFIWSHELADSFANGTATRADAEQHLRNLLEPVERIFAANPRPQPATCRALFATGRTSSVR